MTEFDTGQQISRITRIKEPILTDCSALQAHFARRALVFSKRLTQAAVAIGIEEDTHDTPEMTGAGMCGVASAAIADALDTIAPDFETSIITFEALRDTKRLKTASNHSVPAIHYATRTTDMNGTTLILDGTYGQIDRDFTGTILCIEESERLPYFPYSRYAEELHGLEVVEFVEERKLRLVAQSHDNTLYTRLVNALL